MLLVLKARKHLKRKVKDFNQHINGKHHENDPEVKKFNCLEKGDKERKRHLALLRKRKG